MTAAATVRPWYRQVWPWLLTLPPLFAVIGGVTMLVLALRTPSVMAVADYARIEELTLERFALDSQAAQRGLSARVRFDADRIELELDGMAEPPLQLLLNLQHVTDSRLDRVVVFSREGNTFIATHAVMPGSYHLELLPPDRSWRLAAAPMQLAGAVRLQAQVAGS